ncbi:hypothetical protein BCR34DRAFT_219893 [Clohesyomyces aquaticus]|uniref:Uncharacterized protein n=1 Tax=Clohesyomyces aquaticus TaxID=1231657 RepID=A0A1Y1Y9I0_9PLEO|nr:hypothetical protein BCR34DRAFT_219893 [Clohesyomyces aquaticus]
MFQDIPKAIFNVPFMIVQRFLLTSSPSHSCRRDFNRLAHGSGCSPCTRSSTAKSSHCTLSRTIITFMHVQSHESETSWKRTSSSARYVRVTCRATHRLITPLPPPRPACISTHTRHQKQLAPPLPLCNLQTSLDRRLDRLAPPVKSDIGASTQVKAPVYGGQSNPATLSIRIITRPPHFSCTP